MPPNRVFNFHNARLSLVQSCLREVVCKRIAGGAGPGLWAEHPIVDAASAVLDGIDRGVIGNAAAARAAYRAERSAGPVAQVEMPAGVAEDCLDLMAEYALAWLFNDSAAMAEIRSEFTDSTCDPGWLTALVAWLDYYWDGRAPQYNPPAGDDPEPIPLPAPASPDGLLRVGFLGDWGTGQSEAITVLDQLMQQEPDVIIHVGDIYYAGTADECQSNFLELINAARTTYGRQVPVYALAGNHDYYSGGAGYYAMIPQINSDPTGPPPQTHSFFCLRDDDWQLEGMDTGYNDHDLLKVAEDITWLRDDEVAWHAKQIAGAGSRRVILFSHHQLFSAFQTIGGAYQNPYLTANLKEWKESCQGNIVAWLWGHEHLLGVYADPAPDGSGLPIVGRCIGHGAFPVFTGPDIYTPKPGAAPLLATTEPPYYIRTGDDGLIYDHGYALLTLGQGSGTATYYQVTIPADGSAPSSQPLWSESIPVTGGKPGPPPAE